MRKLEITVDAAWLDSGKHYFPLPEGWDDMSAEEQQQTTDDIVADLVWNRVTATSRVVEGGR